MKFAKVPRPVWADHRVRKNTKRRGAAANYFWIADHGDHLMVCPAFAKVGKAPPVLSVPEPLATEWRETMKVIE